MNIVENLENIKGIKKNEAIYGQPLIKIAFLSLCICILYTWIFLLIYFIYSFSYIYGINSFSWSIHSPINKHLPCSFILQLQIMSQWISLGPNLLILILFLGIESCNWNYGFYIWMFFIPLINISILFSERYSWFTVNLMLQLMGAFRES